MSTYYKVKPMDKKCGNEKINYDFNYCKNSFGFYSYGYFVLTTAFEKNVASVDVIDTETAKIIPSCNSIVSLQSGTFSNIEYKDSWACCRSYLGDHRAVKVKYIDGNVRLFVSMKTDINRIYWINAENISLINEVSRY